jgi:hypothetical protein
MEQLDPAAAAAVQLLLVVMVVEILQDLVVQQAHHPFQVLQFPILVVVALEHTMEIQAQAEQVVVMVEILVKQAQPIVVVEVVVAFLVLMAVMVVLA